MNGGAAQKITEITDKNSPNIIVMNTVVSSATSGLAHVLLSQFSNVFWQDYIIQKTGQTQQNDIIDLCMSIIAGTVSITACCNNVSMGFAVIIGFLACLIFKWSKQLFSKYEIDDPLYISQTHGICGFFSIIAGGMFDLDNGFLTTG